MKGLEDITSRDVDFAKWYTDVVTKANLVYNFGKSRYDLIIFL